MRSIRAGMGLGDSLYLQSVVRHIVETTGETLQVCSSWPDVFLPLKDWIELAPFTRAVQICAHYTTRKGLAGTTQFQDMCLAAGLGLKVDLRIDWQPTNLNLIDQVRAPGKPIVCVQLPRSPMGRTDGMGSEILPQCEVIQDAIDALGGRATVVQIGSGEPLHRFNGIDIDLAGKTRVAEVLDVASVAQAFIGYCSFMVPLAESLQKPALFIWSRRIAKARHPFIRQITPTKILHRPSSRFVFDDAPADQIKEAARALIG